MVNVSQDVQNEELPLKALILQCTKDRYKIGYAALRWAKEIKQKENLPDPIPHLIPRALREILSGKVTIADVEKLPMAIKIAPPPPPTLSGSAPTITLNPSDESVEPPLTPVAGADLEGVPSAKAFAKGDAEPDETGDEKEPEA